MKVEEVTWLAANNALIERRKNQGHSDDNRKIDNAIRDYKLHLTKVKVGQSVLDVGAGSCFLKECLPPSVEYFAVDAFPYNPGVIEGKIEDKIVADYFTTKKIDTACAFACLDMCQDFDKAISNMKAIAQKNVVILTGIDIPVNYLHTFMLTLNDFRSRFSDWKETYLEYFSPQVILIEFTK